MLYSPLFNGDVVLESLNLTFRDEDSILDQIYKKHKKVQIFIFKMYIYLKYNSTGLSDPLM